VKLSLCNEVIREMPFEAQGRFAADLCYAGLEIAPFTLSDAPHTLRPAQVAEVRRALADAGIACSSLHWLLLAPEGLSITAADDAVRARTVDVMQRLVDLAAELGAACLVHGSPGQRALPQDDAAAARDRAVACFAAAGEAAAAAGVLYCIEPLSRRETSFVNTVAEAAAIVDAVGSPGLRTMIDTSATARDGGDPAAVLDDWYGSGLIAHVQVNDPSRRGPGQGDLGFAPFLAGLRRHGYGGWVAVEPFEYVPDGPGCAARAAGYLTGVLEGLR